MVLVGGSATVWGPLVGATVVVALQQYLTVQLGTSDWDLILYGALLLAIALALPDGILPALSRRWRARASAPGQSAPEESWSAANGEEAMVAASVRVPIPPARPVASAAPREVIADEGAPAQPPEPLPAPVPRRHGGIAPAPGLAQKVRAPAWFLCRREHQKNRPPLPDP